MKSDRSKPEEITFILPCAGEGRRLGYHGHKELYPILPGKKLIDFALSHIKEANGVVDRIDHLSVKVIVVIRPSKTAVLDYVRSCLPGCEVHGVFFDDRLFEWPGSVHSASRFYSSTNIVLLPDSWLAMSRDCLTVSHGGKTLVEQMRLGLGRYPVVFGCKRCQDTGLLQNLGAVHAEFMEDDQIVELDYFQDKPRKDLDRFNGFWCSYGFRAEAGDVLYRYLISSVQKKAGQITEETFYPVGAFGVIDYQDLGTPEAVKRFREARVNH